MKPIKYTIILALAATGCGWPWGPECAYQEYADAHPEECGSGDEGGGSVGSYTCKEGFDWGGTPRWTKLCWAGDLTSAEKNAIDATWPIDGEPLPPWGSDHNCYTEIARWTSFIRPDAPLLGITERETKLCWINSGEPDYQVEGAGPIAMVEYEHEGQTVRKMPRVCEDTQGLVPTGLGPDQYVICLDGTACESAMDTCRCKCDDDYFCPKALGQDTVCYDGLCYYDWEDIPEPAAGPGLYGLAAWEDGIEVLDQSVVVTEAFAQSFALGVGLDNQAYTLSMNSAGTSGTATVTHCGTRDDSDDGDSLCAHVGLSVGDTITANALDLNSDGSLGVTIVRAQTGSAEHWTISVE